MTELSAALQAIFDDNRDDFRRRISTLEDAVTAIRAGSLGEQLRAAAQCDAHKLAGALGTFGLHRGSGLARELEQRLAPSHRSRGGDDAHLAACVRGLLEELDGRPAEGRPAETLDPGHPAGGDAVGVGDTAHKLSDNRVLRRATVFETGLAGSGPAPLTCGRILVVDDDPSVRDVLVSILTDAGYDVRGVGSAREARHALEHDTIALLLSDVSMPGETGIDLIRFALCEHPQTATLLISGLDDPGVAQVALDFGAYGYLSKPVRRSAVLIGVMNALRRRDVEARERAARENLEHIVKLRTDALAQALQRLEVAAEHGRVLQAETIHRWARSAEHHEPGISGHLDRMSRYCAVMGDKLGLHAESLELASVLHDVGKLAIPDSILIKAGPLTVDERLAVQTHADAGHQMLHGSCSRVLDLAAVIARTHHEKFDGSGYPRGLSGSDIALEGRIAAVADVFDALTSDQASRPAWSVDSALAWMTRERGNHFDPSVIDAFVSAHDQLRTIHAASAPRRAEDAPA